MSIPPKIFDFRTRRSGQVYKADFLLQDMAMGVADRLSMIKRDFAKVLIIGSNNQVFADAIKGKFGIEKLVFVTLDASETISIDEDGFDLVIAAGGLHWLNDLPGVLIQCRRILRPDGLFIGTMLAGQTLIELRHAFSEAESMILGGITPRVAPMAEIRDLGGLLQRAGFALPVADIDPLKVSYKSALSLLHDLRHMNESNILKERSRKTLRKDVLAALFAVYQEVYLQPDGAIPATFEIATLTAWSPGPGQQKPLRPGSAKTSLAAALSTKEFKT